MTRPRMFPDRPRVSPEASRWAVAAKDAGATIWQVAVFTQHCPDTMYRVIARARRTVNPEVATRYVRGWKLRKLAGRLLPDGVRFRCRCGGMSDSPEGHDSCREAA